MGPYTRGYRWRDPIALQGAGTLSDIRDVLKETRKLLDQTKKARCKRCGNEPLLGSLYCETCKVEKEEAAARSRAGKSAGVSASGYKYVHDSTGKLRIASRVIMEEVLGRTLLEHEVVSYRDGDKENLDPSNLFVSWKSGTPLDFFTCRACGARGNVIITGPPTEE